MTGGSTLGTAQEAITAARTYTLGDVMAFSRREGWCSRQHGESDAIEGWQRRATGGLACHGYDGIRLRVKEGCSTACQHASSLDGGANQDYADADHQ